MDTVNVIGRYTCFGIVFVVTAFAFGPTAHAVSITHSGTVYEVTTEKGRADDPTIRALLEDQEWWGNETLAGEFAGLVGAQLGTPNGGSSGPYFAYAYDTTTFSVPFVWACTYNTTTGGTNCLDGDNQDENREYAIATETPVPEPSAMLLLGTGILALAGYRWQQRRREGTQI